MRRSRAALIAEIERRHAAGESYPAISKSMGRCTSWARMMVRYVPKPTIPVGRSVDYRKFVTEAEKIELDACLAGLRAEKAMDEK